MADVVLGAMLGLAFNPLSALAGSAVAGALGARGRTGWAVLVVLAAWAVGDGVRIALVGTEAHLVDAIAGPATSDLVALIAWAAVGLSAGYVVPAWAGTFVGSRVTHGTGWLAGGMVAATLSTGLVMLAR